MTVALICVIREKGVRGDVNAVNFAEFVDLTLVAKVELVIGNVLEECGLKNQCVFYYLAVFCSENVQRVPARPYLSSGDRFIKGTWGSSHLLCLHRGSQRRHVKAAATAGDVR